MPVPGAPDVGVSHPGGPRDRAAATLKGEPGDPHVHATFLRPLVRAFIEKGPVDSHESYRDLMDLVHVPGSGEQEFMDFQRRHTLDPDP